MFKILSELLHQAWIPDVLNLILIILFAEEVNGYTMHHSFSGSMDGRGSYDDGN